MKLLSLRRVATFALAAIALMGLGCSDNSTQPKVAKPRYPEATTKEIVIGNLLKSYEDRNIDQYAKLLHQDYVWYNQDGVLPQYYAEEEDIQHTGNMFLAALHTHPNPTLWLDKLELKLFGDVWMSVSEFDHLPCDDCWETTREYYLELRMAGGAVTYIANGQVQFVVVPVEVNGTKLYKIRRCHDIPKL
jgi:hypothetical protein